MNACPRFASGRARGATVLLASAVLATWLVALLAVMSSTEVGASPGVAQQRVPRTFEEKARDLRYPLAPVEKPLPLRRAVLPKSMVALEPTESQRDDRLIVKFIEGYRVRLRDGELVELGGRVLPGVLAARGLTGASRIERLFTRSEADLDRDRAFAIERSGVGLADLNNYYMVHLDDGAEPAVVAAAWLALEVVEIAYFENMAELACTDIAPPTPEFRDSQNYLEPAPLGVDAYAAWAFDPAGNGVPEFLMVDIEFGWNVDHEDFGDVTVLNGPPEPDMNHGTGVLGEVVGCDNDFGVTGICNEIAAGGVNWSNEPNGAAALDRAASFLNPGEIYLIELHTGGPGPIPGWVCECNCGQFGYVPMEWDQSLFDAIQLHTAAGIIVVEAGGNGGMDLDHPFYNGIFDRTFRDSGAIMVGAGSDTQHSPECWTNYGSRIDCQGYGRNVVTTGYGGLFDPGDENQWYTATFSGTSSASPIVTGCAAVVQNISQQLFGLTLDAISMRGALSLFGTPQGAPLEKHIGVLPDLAAIIDAWFQPTIDHTPLPDTTNEIEDYEVAAVVTPALLNFSLQSVTVHYSVSGAAYQSAPMTPGGGPNGWLGAIPAQAAGSYVLYYLEAVPAYGPPTYFPDGAATDPLLFIVGTMAPFAVDDLEAPSGWTVGAPDDDATAGFWERGDPHATYIGNLIVAPEEDHTPEPGVMAFVTANPGPGAVASDGDVDDGKTTLFSPLLDFTAENYVRLSAWVWARFLFDDALRIDISNDAGQTWMSLGEVTTDLEEWQLVEYEIRRETVPYTDQMQLRVVASDYGVQTVVDCGIDDLVVAGLAQQSQGVEAPVWSPPPRVVLSPAAPNPCRAGGATMTGGAAPGGPGTRVRYTLPVAGEVRLAVYDVAGRLVRALVRGEQPAGAHVARWDCRDERGGRVGPGVYYLRLDAAGEQRARAVVVLR